MASSQNKPRGPLQIYFCEILKVIYMGIILIPFTT